MEPDGTFTFSRVMSATSPLVGTWYASGPDGIFAFTFTDDGQYMMVEDGDPAVNPGGQDGMERGTYTWNAATGAFTWVTTVDTNGEWGLSHGFVEGVGQAQALPDVLVGEGNGMEGGGEGASEHTQLVSAERHAAVGSVWRGHGPTIRAEGTNSH